MTKAHFQDVIQAAIPRLIGQLHNSHPEASIYVLAELAKYGKTRLRIVVMWLMNARSSFSECHSGCHSSAR